MEDGLAREAQLTVAVFECNPIVGRHSGMPPIKRDATGVRSHPQLVKRFLCPRSPASLAAAQIESRRGSLRTVAALTAAAFDFAGDASIPTVSPPRWSCAHHRLLGLRTGWPKDPITRSLSDATRAESLPVNAVPLRLDPSVTWRCFCNRAALSCAIFGCQPAHVAGRLTTSDREIRLPICAW